MLVIYFYLGREYYKVLKFQVNGFSNFEISDPSFKCDTPIDAAP